MKGKTNEVKQLEVALGNYKENKATTSKELDAVLTYLDKLKPQCETKVGLGALGSGDFSLVSEKRCNQHSVAARGVFHVVLDGNVEIASWKRPKKLQAMSYGERKAKREQEIAGLKEALTILSGESLLQVKTTLRGARRVYLS